MDDNRTELRVSSKPEPVKAQVIARSLAGENKSKIARELKITRNTVSRILSEANMSNLNMPELLGRHGITGDVLVQQYLKPGLDAMETEFGKFKGMIVDQKDVIAWGPRLEALDMTFRLLNAYPRENAESRGNMTFNVVISAPRPTKQLDGE